MLQNFKSIWVPVVTVIVAVMSGYFLGVYFERGRVEEARVVLKSDASEQLRVLTGLSTIMARGGSDASAELVIKDCSAEERSRFDILLGRLAGGMERAELLELSRLFDRCGSYFSRQKAVMANRLEREVEAYAQILEHQVLLGGEGEEDLSALLVWRELVRLEKEQSELFSKLVTLQERIITDLLGGEAQSSPKIDSLMTEVREVYEMLSYTVLQLKEKRDSLPRAN